LNFEGLDLPYPYFGYFYWKLRPTQSFGGRWLIFKFSTLLPISRQYITSETWSWSIHNHKEKKLLATKASQALSAKSLKYHYFICFLTSFSRFWQGSTGRLSRIWRHLLRQGLGFSGYQCRSTVKRLVKVHLLGETLIDLLVISACGIANLSCSYADIYDRHDQFHVTLHIK